MDETAKKPEDEELDRDADFSAQPVDEHEFAEEEDDDDHHTGENVDEAEDDDDDEFTSQLGPEEQDRMSMMFDADGDHEMADSTMHEDQLTHQLDGHHHQLAVHPFKPSPLAAFTPHDENSDMNMMS